MEGLYTSGRGFASLWKGPGSAFALKVKSLIRNGSALKWKDGSGSALQWFWSPSLVFMIRKSFLLAKSFYLRNVFYFFLDLRKGPRLQERTTISPKYSIYSLFALSRCRRFKQVNISAIWDETKEITVAEGWQKHKFMLAPPWHKILRVRNFH